MKGDSKRTTLLYADENELRRFCHVAGRGETRNEDTIL